MLESLKAIVEILWKGILPPALSMSLVILGLLMGNVYAWTPILLTIGGLVVLFVYRIRQKEVQDVMLMLRPFATRPIQEILDECDFLKPKR